MADEAAVPEVAAEEALPQGKTYTQADVDAISAKVAEGTKRRTEEALLERMNKEAEERNMTELERERNNRAMIEQRAKDAEEALGFERKRTALRDAGAAKGIRSPVYLEHVLFEAADDEDFDPEALAEKALELYNQDHIGVAQNYQPKTAARTTGVLNSSGDISKWTPQQAVDHSRTFKTPREANDFIESYERATGRKR